MRRNCAAILHSQLQSVAGASAPTAWASDVIRSTTVFGALISRKASMNALAACGVTCSVMGSAGSRRPVLPSQVSQRP